MDRPQINSTRKRFSEKRSSGQVVAELLTKGKGAKKMHFLNFKSSRTINPFRFKRQARHFVRDLAAKGAFNGEFSPEELALATKSGKLPDSYVVDYKIPLELGGLNCPDNMYVVDCQVLDLMAVLYWHQIRILANAFKHTNKTNGSARMGILCSPIPSFFDQKAFLNFILPDDLIAVKSCLQATQKRKKKAESEVVASEHSNGVVLNMENPPALPPHMEMALVQVQPIPQEERDRIALEYEDRRNDIVIASLKRGDFKKLSRQELRQIEQIGRVPAHLSCHHILPRELGGSNEMQNICWLPTKAHEMLHQKFLTPLTNHLYKIIEQQGLEKSVFLEMPVPEGAKISKFFIKDGVLKRISPKFRRKIQPSKLKD